MNQELLYKYFKGTTTIEEEGDIKHHTFFQESFPIFFRGFHPVKDAVIS